MRVAVVGAGGADCLVADGLDRANVVEEAAAQVDGEGFAAVEHVGEALVRGVAAGEQRAGEQKDFAGTPGLDVVAGDGGEIDAAGVGGGVGELGPGVERGGRDGDWAGAVEPDVQVARGGAVGDDGDGEIGRVGGAVEDLDVEDGGEAAEALRADAELVDAVI
jgi:hypothetical protein